VKKIILLLIILFSQFIYSQYNSLRIGGVVIELGVQFDYLIKNLNDVGIYSKEIKTNAINNFFYLYKSNKESEFLGSISFVDGKLTSIQKYWGPYNPEENCTNYLEDYFEILNNFIDNNNLVTTKKYYEPDLRLKKIIIISYNKEVELLITPIEIQITERIEEQ
jgi:hypothetical protein